MKRKLLFILIALLGLSFSGFANPPIIPLPQSFSKVGEEYKINDQLKIYFDNEFANEAYYMQKQLFKIKNIITSYEANKAEADIILAYDNTNSSQPKGAYSLKMNTKEIIISSNNDEGIINGVSSLLQIVAASDKNISCWNIDDYPQHQWRGFMLDESRHFFGKEKVKQLLDYMALYKLNKFHWHLTDEPGWRIEIKKYPLLTYTGGVGTYTDHNAPPKYYTQNDIEEIVRYASERKIEVIPEIDMPGHARAANRAYPEYSGGGSERYPEFTFDPGNEDTYQYLTDILKEINVMFPSEKIHLGGDEVHFGNEQWNHNEGIKKLMEKENLKDLPEVEKYFMIRMADSLYAMNNTFLAWDEMADISLPTDQTIIFWWRHDKRDQLQKALEKNYSVVLCPRIPMYFDFVQSEEHKVGRRWVKDFSPLELVYNFDVENIVDIKYGKQVLGFQANLWSETVQTEQRLDYMIYPRISALAEAAWGQNNDYDDYLKRLDQHLPLYRKDNIYFFNPLSPSENAEPKK